jgi:methylmalonyl-CoA mutase cobalamin-binding subunit
VLAATRAAAAGWKTTYLGPNLPAAEIAGAVQKNATHAVALSIVHPADDPHLGPELLQLRRFLADDVNLLVGGRAASGYRQYLDEIGAHHLPCLEDLRTYLKSIGAGPDA